MIDAKSNQIPLLTKGQTKADINKEPIGFSDFSLDIDTTGGSREMLAPRDVTDDSAKPEPGTLTLAEGAIVLVRLDNALPIPSGRNSDPILASYGKGPAAQSAGDTRAAARTKAGDSPASAQVPVGPNATIRDVFTGETLPFDGPRERPGAFAIVQAHESGPALTASGAIAGTVPTAPVLARSAANVADGLDPLRRPIQPVKVRGPDGNVVASPAVAQAPKSAASDKLAAGLAPPQSSPLPVGQFMAERPVRSALKTGSGPDAGLKTVAAGTTEFNAFGDAKNIEKPLLEDQTREPSDWRQPLLPAGSPGQMPVPPGKAFNRTIGRSVPLAAADPTPSTVSTARGGVKRDNRSANELSNLEQARPAEPTVATAVSKDIVAGSGLVRNTAATGPEPSRTMPAAAQPVGPLGIPTDPRLVENEPELAARKTHRAAKKTAVDTRSENAAGQLPTAVRYAAGGPGLSVQTSGPIVPEEAAYSQLFDSKGENALGVIEQRGTTPSLDGAPPSVGARPSGGVPRAVYQIAQAAAAMKDRPVELSLNPEELGRVRLTLHSRDGNLTVNVAADRPETLVFLRRHIDQLATQLRDVGYQDLTFAFSDQGQQSGEGRKGPTEMAQYNNDIAPQWEGDQRPVRINLSEGTGVDIRL